MQPSIGIPIGLVALVLRVSGALARTGTTITDLGLRAGPSPNTELLLTVIGIEGSVAVACLDSSRRSPFFSTSDTYTADVDLLTTVTGRVGYARDKWLAYAKGGWAGADIELTLFDHGTPVRANSSDWANGWTVGGGGEYSICKNLSLGSSTTMPSSIKMVGGSVALPVPQAWAAEYRSSTATSMFNR